jgi:hypothetical protein
MSDQWYYGVGGTRQGPFSGRELRALAEEGRIQPADTIWKEGVPEGVPAYQVKHLFGDEVTPPAAVAPAAAESTRDEAGTRRTPADGTEAAAPEQPAQRPPEQRPPAEVKKKYRAVALKGANIVGQDGETVYFNRRCTKCGHQETGRSRMPIRPGVTRAQFFCPKCKKPRPIEIQGM